MDKFEIALSQHAAHLTRASSSAVSELLSVFDGETNAMLTQLLGLLVELSEAERMAFAAGQYTTSTLKEIRSLLDAWQSDLGDDIAELFAEQLDLFAAQEVEYINKLMKASAMKTAPPIAAATAITAAKKLPTSGGALVDELLMSFSAKARQQVLEQARNGIVSGATNEQIIRTLRGTKANNYTDGLLNASKRELALNVRTIRNHVSNVTYVETYKKSGAKYVQLVATLDSRTSKQCASFDGKRWRIDEWHPVPPLHPNCRSVLRPIFSKNEKLESNRPSNGDERGTVSANVNFNQFLKQQSADFQKEWLGTTRYKLWKEGKYPLDRFIDPLGKQYTLAELRQRDEQTFKDLFDE